MSRAKVLTTEVQDKIAGEYGSIKAKDLAEKYSCTIDQVYEVAKRRKLTQRHNKIVNLSYLQEQIIFGGLLGDGRLKRNGRNNYYYSECHALGESDYLRWKFNSLGELTSGHNIYPKNNNLKDVSDALEFTTLTTPSLKKYVDMSKLDIIKQLDELGLIIYLLDDGWLNSNTKLGNLTITTYPLTSDEREALHRQWKKIADISFHNSGIKRVNSSTSSKNTQAILKLVLKYIPKDTDVVKKKFKNVIANV